MFILVVVGLFCQYVSRGTLNSTYTLKSPLLFPLLLLKRCEKFCSEDDDMLAAQNILVFKLLLVRIRNLLYLLTDPLRGCRFVSCVSCGRRQHQICVEHLDQICTSGFVCCDCRRLTNQTRPANPYTAESERECCIICAVFDCDEFRLF